MGLDRRQMLIGGGVFAAAAVAGWGQLRGKRPLLLSAADDAKGQHCLLGLESDGATRFCLPVPFRAHDSLVVDERLAVYFARRPGRHCYFVDTEHGELLATVQAPPGMHFCGHGTLSADRRNLFLTEYAFERQMGVVGVYESQPPFRRLHAFDTYGLDPHQIALLPNTQTLVVANGGILTHPDSERDMLNLDTMAPSLVYLNAQSGALHEQVTPPHHQISLRHLAVAADGAVVVGAQNHTAGIEDHPHPLVFQHRVGEPLRALQASPQEWNSMRQYIASIVINDAADLALSTTPRGGLISLWRLPDGQNLGHFPVRDVAGAAWLPEENSFLVSNGLGQLVYLRLTPQPHLEMAAHQPGLHWDNHLNRAV